jgi:hypothetical protein
MAWDGRERRFHLCQHGDDIAVIKNTIINMDRKLETSISDFRKHTDESGPVRETVAKLTEYVKGMDEFKARVWAVAFTLVFSMIGMFSWLFSIGVSFGEIRNKVEHCYEIVIKNKGESANGFIKNKM